MQNLGITLNNPLRAHRHGGRAWSKIRTVPTSLAPCQFEKDIHPLVKEVILKKRKVLFWRNSEVIDVDEIDHIS